MTKAGQVAEAFKVLKTLPERGIRYNWRKR
jgi:pentatricopeptide repeat protein